VVVVRNGYIVFEEYYKGDKDDAPPLYYSTAPIVGVLTGIAIGEGYLQSVDQKAIDFFPEHAQEVISPHMQEITLAHLLTMTAGFVGHFDLADVKSILRSSLLREPGQRYAHSNTGANLLSAILTKATGMSALEFGDQYLFGPLGISTPRWDTSGYGYNYGGDGLYLRPRDLAKIGYLYLNKGVWDREVIVPSEWVEESTRRHLEFDFPELGKYDYGYLWMLTSVDGQPAFLDDGVSFGQLIYVIPDLDIVVVITSGLELQRRVLHIVEEMVVPAVLD